MHRVLPPVYFLGAILLMLSLHFLAPLGKLIESGWRMMGLIPLLAGIVLNLRADGRFKQAETTVKPLESASVLVRDGVFAISRNPMYLGMVLIVAGLAILLGTVSPWLVVPVLGILFDRVYINLEERRLAEIFGTEFADYRRQVRRWF